MFRTPHPTLCHAAAGLPRVSARASKIAAIEPERIVRTLGTLAKGERAAGAQAVVGFVGPTRSD